MKELLLFLLSLSFIEGLLKPVITYFTQRQIRKYVPLVLDRLDPVLPQWIAEYGEEELREKVIGVIFDVGKELDDTPNAEAVLTATVSQYSFLVNAAKLVRGQE